MVHDDDAAVACNARILPFSMVASQVTRPMRTSTLPFTIFGLKQLSFRDVFGEVGGTSLNISFRLKAMLTFRITITLNISAFTIMTPTRATFFNPTSVASACDDISMCTDTQNTAIQAAQLIVTTMLLKFLI